MGRFIPTARSLFYVLGLAALLLQAAPGRAEDRPALAPFDFSAVYWFGWDGITFGTMAFTAHETPGHLSEVADVRSSSLINLFASHKSHTTLEATLGDSISTSPRHYETNYFTNKEPRRVKLVYAKGGAVTEEIVEPPENRAKRPEVPADEKKGSLDPLSFAFALRQALYDALREGKDHIALRFYEGRRLMDAEFTVAGRTFLKTGGEKMPVIVLIGKRKPIAGFTEKELLSLKGGEPLLYAYFSDDAMLIPLRLELPLILGPLRINLVKRCEVSAPCTLEPEKKR